MKPSEASALAVEIEGAHVKSATVGVVSTGGPAVLRLELGFRGTDDGDVQLDVPVEALQARAT